MKCKQAVYFHEKVNNEFANELKMFLNQNLIQTFLFCNFYCWKKIAI